jgi:hypothetical protein
MSDLPRVNISQGGYHETGEIEYPVMSAPWMEQEVRTEFPGGRAGDHVLVPAERWDEAPRVWWCETHKANKSGEWCLRAHYEVACTGSFREMCAWIEVRLVETE